MNFICFKHSFIGILESNNVSNTEEHDLSDVNFKEWRVTGADPKAKCRGVGALPSPERASGGRYYSKMVASRVSSKCLLSWTKYDENFNKKLVDYLIVHTYTRTRTRM
jgi:hypothetical protein